MSRRLRVREPALGVDGWPLIWHLVRMELCIAFIRFFQIPLKRGYQNVLIWSLRFRLKRAQAKFRRLTLVAERNQKRHDLGGPGAPRN